MPNPIGRALRNRRAGHDTLAWGRPDLLGPDSFTLTSPAFDHGTPIPYRYRGRIIGSNISPALEWTAPPADTVELVLVVEDPDAPRSTAAVHALARGIDPALNGLPENALVNPSPIRGITHGRGPLGHLGWVGPAPIPSHGPHAYVFQLFALDANTNLQPKFSLDDAVAAMAGHVIGRARLDGTYEVA